jgi:Phage integrase family
MPKQEHPFSMEQFQAVVDPRVVAAPRINWEQVQRRTLNYLIEQVAGSLWVNHLALLVGVSICHARLDPKTVDMRLRTLHRRWQILFPAYHLTGFAEWDPAIHIPRYMTDLDLEDSLETRHQFLSNYTSSVWSLQMYFHSLPEPDRVLYAQWNLPPLPTGMRKQVCREQELQEAQARRRKAESDAVTPHFAQIRSESHVRWNELYRLRQKFQEVGDLVRTGQAALPVAFSYEEARRKQRLHFLLWNRSSFVLAHADQYPRSVVTNARYHKAGYRPEHNHFFLEFVGADNLAEKDGPRDPDALLWFGDLLRYNVIGKYATSGTPEEVQRKQAYLRSWGYGTGFGIYGVGDDSERDCQPFLAEHPGILSGLQADGSAEFIDAACKRSQGPLLHVEQLFAAATFGLAALDFFLTTGGRMNELLQISLTPECLYTMMVEGTQRLLIRLIPKGRDLPADYMVGPETVRNFEHVAHLLKEHYQLQAGDVLPSVAIHADNNRAPDFPDCRPYLFQYHGKHFSYRTITACLRFLCHGMVFTNAEGKAVVLKAHLLRHVFATHLRQVEGVPLDIVAVILHQKSLRITSYYAAPQWKQVVEATDTLLDTFATHLGNVEDAFVRAPAELQHQWETAKKTVGTLARVPGGDCTCHALCPFSYVCTGCVYKVPDPSRREEIEEQKHWAMIRLDQVKRRGMGPETVKMEVLIGRCNTELEEMTLIEEYRNDEQYNPPVHIERDEEHQPSVAQTASSGHAATYDHTGPNYCRSTATRREDGHA